MLEFTNMVFIEMNNIEEKIAELILDNHFLLLVLERFEINLGLQDKTINDVCIEMPVIFGNSMHIRNTILFSGQLIQYLRQLGINYYSGLTRRSVTAMFLKKAFLKSDLELSVIKSNDVLLKIIMKRIYGADMPIKTNDEIQALALYQFYVNKTEEEFF